MDLSIRLHFLEPFRLIEWCEHNKRNHGNDRWLRGQTFARWHKDAETLQGRPYITGTLLRSAVIRAAEEELARVDSPWQSCGGLFFTEDGTKPMHLRHRATVQKGKEKESCNDRASACPFCLLLGRFDEFAKGKAVEVKDKILDVRFENLSLPGKPLFDSPKGIGDRRTINRVDDFTGKAHDFFSIWEIDQVRDFHGKIILADDLPRRVEVESLLRHALGFVERLCGARCTIEVNGDAKQLELPGGMDYVARIDRLLEKIDIPYSRMRMLADAVRNLRQCDPRAFGLPKGRQDKDGRIKDHYIWGTRLNNNRKLSEELEELAAQCAGDKAKWRRVCEEEGQKIYNKSKDIKGSPSSPGRHLGAAEQVREPKPPVSYTRESTHSLVPDAEWIVTGILKAETPFSVGMDAASDNDQTSLRTLVDRDGRYRMPRSTLRGILRRDLSVASGDQGCRVELGPERPCSCPVCRILRAVTVADTLSDCDIPADIRQRIRINPVTGSVADGALFDSEAGPKGAGFPFVLRYRGNADCLPKDLQTVLTWWREGKCFAGGDGGVGRGRFTLDGLKMYRWDLSTAENRKSYAANVGLRRPEDEADLETWCGLLDPKDQLVQIELAAESNQFPWQECTWKFSFSGPLLQGDPLAALNTDTADIVSFARTVVKDGVNERQYVLRGEGLRGLLRTAVARAAHAECDCRDDKDCKKCQEIKNLLTRDHQDCTCILCQLFGSEHKAGIIRIEDLVPIGGKPADKRVDHVCIDRFDQSVVEKFDDRPLIGSPENPLVFSGSFWVKEKELDKNKALEHLLNQAWLDIAAGLYPVGGKSGIGYGWVSGLEVRGRGKIIIPPSSQIAPPGCTLVANLQTGALPVPPTPSIAPAPGAIFNPHYFLPPDESKPPERVTDIIRHDSLDGNKFTGRISCSLEVNTPLIIPDTEAEQPKDAHKEYLFFSLNGVTLLPAAALRAAISQVYEALTNSCFRIVKQKRYLTWRMETQDYQDFLPGRVCNGGKQIRQMGERAIRFPLYDDPDITVKIKDQPEVAECITSGDDKLIKTMETNRKIAEAARHNQAYLADLAEEDRAQVLRGLKKVPFWTESMANNDDVNFLIAKLGDRKDKSKKSGYLKVTGPNNANLANLNKDDDGKYQLNWDDPLDFSFRLSGPPRCLPNSQSSREFPRPGFTCIKGGKEYSITKRCERVFEEVSGGINFSVPDKLREQYSNILDAYRQNSGNIAEGFRTRLYAANELRDGDLIYFKAESRVKPDGKTSREITAITPVCISRLADDRPVGRRLPEGFQPCAHVCLENCSTCGARKKECVIPLYQEGYPVHGLCPACRLFGSQMFRGRVSFGFASPANESIPEFITITLPLLERPRPTWVLPKRVQGTGTRVPGRKFYLRHDGWKKIMPVKNPDTDEAIQKTKNNATVQAIMPGARFSFKIMAENLELRELGLLIYCLELEEGMTHSLGRGKPLGFGSIRIKVEKLEQRRADGQWHTILGPQGTAITTPLVRNALHELAGKNWPTTLHIAGLRLLLSRHSGITARYPELTNEGNSGKPPGYEELRKIHDYDANRMLRLDESGPQPWYTGG